MKDILFNLIPELKNNPQEYIDSVLRRYQEFMTYSQIPERCIGFMDQEIIPTRLYKLFGNMQEAVQDRYNFIFKFKDYRNLCYLAYLMLQAYFKQCYHKEAIIEDILYIDTKLLVEDYKKLMDFSESNLSPELVHSLSVLYGGIEKAALVIWDKFEMLDSKFDRDKIYDILSVRQRRGLSNFYFTMQTSDNLLASIGNIATFINDQDLYFDCESYIIDIPKNKEVDKFKC